MTAISVDSFFEFVQDRVSTNAQDACGIADAAAIERHVYHLPFDLRQSPFVLILQEKDPPLTVQVIAPKPLGAIGLPPVFHDRTAPALGTLDLDNRHGSS